MVSGGSARSGGNLGARRDRREVVLSTSRRARSGKCAYKSLMAGEFQTYAHRTSGRSVLISRSSWSGQGGCGTTPRASPRGRGREEEDRQGPLQDVVGKALELQVRRGRGPRLPAFDQVDGLSQLSFLATSGTECPARSRAHLRTSGFSPSTSTPRPPPDVFRPLIDFMVARPHRNGSRSFAGSGSQAPPPTRRTSSSISRAVAARPVATASSRAAEDPQLLPQDLCRSASRRWSRVRGAGGR